MDSITLRPKYSDKTISLPRSIVRLSSTLNNMLTDSSSQNNVVIVTEKIYKYEILKLIVHFMLELSISEEKNEATDINIPEWHQKYLPDDPQDLIRMYNATNYLDINELKQSSLKKLALNHMKGKTTKDYNILLNIKQDMTEDEINDRDKKFDWILKTHTKN